MLVNKNFSLKGILGFAGLHLVWITAYVTIFVAIYEMTHWAFMSIPWLPISMIGTAVAFYIGFKNNHAYSRVWEARKIWGGIVNDSRKWGSMVKAYLDNGQNSADEINIVKKDLIHRHIGWLYRLREQLLTPTPWEHVNQGKHIGGLTQRRIQKSGVGQFESDLTDQHLKMYLNSAELSQIKHTSNMAVQILDYQSQKLSKLRRKGILDEFKHIELQNIINNFYDHQGKCERIKKFPLPRQYGALSFIFVGIFVFLLPFGIVAEFHKMGDFGSWLSIPFTILACWVYIVMELIGDYTENPFEGMSNDIPMFSLVRTVEIDLKEMLGEANVPKPIEAVNGVLL